MREFIKTQYKIYCLGGTSIGIKKIQKLAQIYLSLSEYDEMFSQENENLDNYVSE